MRRVIAVFLVSCLGLACSASASSIDDRLPIYYAWALDELFPTKPDHGHYSMRIVPRRKTAEVLLDTDGSVVRVRQAKSTLWSELKEVLRSKPSISADRLAKAVDLVETTVSSDQCPPLAAALESIRAAYSTPLPNSWYIYADGPDYTFSRDLEFAGDEIISHPHVSHPVAQAWFRAIVVLNACGTRHIIADDPAP